MPQFTPPQSQLSPLIGQLISDRLRQQQFERTQNALILKERRTQQMKLDAEDRKHLRALAKDLAAAGINPSQFVTGQGVDELGAYSALAKAGAVGEEKSVRENLQPLADIGANLQPFRPGAPESPEVARNRQAFGTGILQRGMANDPRMLAQLGEQMGQGVAGRREDIAKERRTERRLREREFGEVKVGHKIVSGLEDELSGMIAQAQQNGTLPDLLSSKEFKRKQREYELVRGRSERDAFGTEEGGFEISIGSDGTVSVRKGSKGVKPTFGAMSRVYQNVQQSDAIVDDIDNILDAYKNDQTTLGAPAAAQHLWYNLQGLAEDYGNLIYKDVEPGQDVIEPGQESAIQQALETGNVWALKQLEPKAFRDIKEDTIQGHRLTELRLAYYFVRMNRGNGRVTAREIADAMSRLSLVKWTRSSRQVAATLRQFRHFAQREAKRGRASSKDLMDLEIPRLERETPWAPTPLPEEHELEEPTALKGKVRGALETLDLGTKFESFAESLGFEGGEE